MTDTANEMNRRTFLNNTVKVIGAGAALGTNALSYGRIAGRERSHFHRTHRHRQSGHGTRRHRVAIKTEPQH